MSTRITFVDDELAHYGVKGMRWGVIKARHDGKVDARRKISASNSPRMANIQRARGTDKALDKKYKNSDQRNAYEHGRQKELRRQMKKLGRGFEVSNRIGDPKTKQVAAKQSKTSAKIRRGAVRAGKVAGLAAAIPAGVFAYKASKMLREDPALRQGVTMFKHMVKNAIELDREFARAQRQKNSYTI